MGILVDVENNILKIPDEKMTEIRSLCVKWAQKQLPLSDSYSSYWGKLL